MNCGVFYLKENAGVHWRSLVAEKPLAWVGCRVHGGRLDSFCPVAAQDHTILPDEIVLCLEQEQLHTKALILELTVWNFYPKSEQCSPQA